MNYDGKFWSYLRPASLATIFYLAILFCSPALADDADADETDATEAAAEVAEVETPEEVGDNRDQAQIIESDFHAERPVHVGDALLYVVVVEHHPDLHLQISSPPEGSRWRELDRNLTVERESDITTTRAELRFAVYRPGPTRGPPVSALLVSNEGADPVALDLPGHSIDIASLTEEGAALGAPRGPRPLWIERALGVWIGGGLAALALAALAGILLFRRRSVEESAIPERPPYEVAMEALEALKSSQYLEEEQWKEFYLSLSGIVRRYLGRRFGFPGTEWTTTEIMARLEALDDPDFRLEARVVGDWMRFCDRVKFAGYLPTTEQAGISLSQAFHIVEETRPSPPKIDGEEGRVDEEPDKESPTDESPEVAA